MIGMLRMHLHKWLLYQ